MNLLQFVPRFVRRQPTRDVVLAPQVQIRRVIMPARPYKAQLKPR